VEVGERLPAGSPSGFPSQCGVRTIRIIGGRYLLSATKR
jgi:hypothetical protein